MKLIQSIKYFDLRSHILWHVQYYDGPLTGYCKINNEFCYFEISSYEFGADLYDIYRLTPSERDLAKLRHFWFQFCVGLHTDYAIGERSHRFPRKRPKWINFILLAIYYKSVKSAYGLAVRNK